jgi:tetratricopeptide (TPR) repeat protein
MSRIGQIIALAVLTTVAGFWAALAKPNGQDSASPLVVEHFRAGQEDLRSGRLGEAVEQFQTVLRLAPGLSQAQINLGLAYHLLGNYKLAVAELNRGLSQNSNVLGGNIVLGIDELRLGAPAQAVLPLERATRIDPSSQQAWSSLAQAYLELENYLQASRAYDAAFGRSATADNWLHLGHAYLQMSNRLTARMAHEYTNTAWAKRLAGDLLCERQQWSDAVRIYQLALARDPAEIGLHSSLAYALLQQGDTAGAERNFQAEIKLDAGNPRALAGITEAELEQGHAHQALIYASKLATTAPQLLPELLTFRATAKQSPGVATSITRELANNPSQPGAHFLLASLYRISGEADQSRRQDALAESELKRLAAEQKPGWPACRAHEYGACARFLASRRQLDRGHLMMLGKAQFALRQYGEACGAFAAAWAQNERGPQNLYWLIRAYSRVAESCFSKLTQEYTRSAQAYQLEAETYRARGDDSRALRQYQVAAALQPANASLHEALGELYLNEHQLSAAHREVAEALQLDPTRARSLYLMGRLEIGLAQPKNAIPYLQNALRFDPDLLEARASLGLAYLRAGKPALAVPQLQRAIPLDYYGDLHYMLYQAYRELGSTDLAENALAASQALRRKTQSRDQALIRSVERQ